MDAAYDCLIKLYHPIRSEKQDTRVVFKLSEENGHETIVSIVVRCALLHERICLIQEKHSLEVFGNLENGLKMFL